MLWLEPTSPKILAAIVLMLAVLFLFEDRAAMQQCEQRHSTVTCNHLLNR